MALARYQGFAIVNNGGRLVVAPGATVQVNNESGGALATLFSDRAGATGIGNPTTADSSGFFFFHVAGGSYKITVTLGSDSYEFRYVAIGTGGETDANQGSATASLDFGSAPGTDTATLAITGLTTIASTARVKAWIQPKDTADHTIDEHVVDPPRVYAGNVVAGTGFTIYGIARDEFLAYGVWNVGYEWTNN